MSKEAARIVKQIQLNKLPNIVIRVAVTSMKEFTSCIEKIAAECPETVIMISADVGRTLFIGTHIPFVHKQTLENWLTNSIISIQEGVLFSNQRSETTSVYSLTYVETSEKYPFKLVDEVNGTAYNILKKLGLQEDESESEEYGLDI